jgi:hypothetical protein
MILPAASGLPRALARALALTLLLLAACAGGNTRSASTKSTNHPGYATYTYGELNDANNTTANPDLVMPNVVGMTVFQANQILLNKHVKVGVHFINGATTANHVGIQQPQAGSRIQPTSTVQIYIVGNADRAECGDATSTTTATSHSTTVCFISLAPKNLP